jgi:hypothetical protein
MSEPKATRFLAAQYASIANHRPLDPYRRRDAGFTLDAFEALGLLDAADAAEWRARMERLGHEASERPLLPEPLRAAARAYVADEADGHTQARHGLEAVGALTWRDAPDPRTPPGLVVERVIAVPPQQPAELTIATVVLFTDVVQVHWYDAQPGVDDRPQDELARGGPFGLSLADDVGTSYAGRLASSAGVRGARAAGRTAFTPRPPAEASWLEVVDRGTPVLRVPLR